MFAGRGTVSTGSYAATYKEQSALHILIIIKCFVTFFLGRYSIKCLGLYCGDCPMVIFISFAGHRECVMTSSRNIVQTDKIIILYLNKWISALGSQPVHVSASFHVNLTIIDLRQSDNWLVLTESETLQSKNTGD